ncbi:SnoaL-like protein [Flavobacterium sp. 90]|uniref:nuclear transport factor 2 family protein n=1 Tax=unclassified Flavobacterium TaxID=196869 RepID=UPI000EB5294F|nr:MULTISPECIES: nuclear transport factor 2 family protein [unclassified Flavobacterium]RKR05759.1 SnoaL-like protein [Flavobacterium sp. 81]TCK57069.1 SnoaL-like protein [Flavobacterium sp. 90]
MTLEILRTKEELRQLIDAYAILGDEKKIVEQMSVFTSDVIYQAYMNDFLAANVSGRENLEKEFNGHASQVKTYFTLNGPHNVTIDKEHASGVSFSQIKMISESEGKDVLTDYSVKYEDQYVYQNGKWLIKKRVGYFIIVESRIIAN